MEKYLCRNKDMNLVVFTDHAVPEYDENLGIFINKQDYGNAYGILTYDFDHLYDSLQPGQMIKSEHIDNMCDFCYRIEKDVKFVNSPLNEEIYDKIEKFNYCPICYSDECDEI